MKHNSLLHEQLKKVSPEVKMEMDLSAAMVEKIESLLASKGMTHRELAKRIGCDESQIIRWTRGFPNFTFNALARISCALEEPLIDTSFYISGPCSGVRGYSFESERVHSLNEPVTEKYRSHQPHQYYRHFRNHKIYRLVDFATLEATEEEAVVYQAMYGERKLWIRTKKNFFEEVLHEGKMVPRFQPISEEEAEKELSPALEAR